MNSFIHYGSSPENRLRYPIPDSRQIRTGKVYARFQTETIYIPAGAAHTYFKYKVGRPETEVRAASYKVM